MKTPSRNLKLISTKSAAETLGLSTRTLERWRRLGCGPVFRKVGRRAMYLEEDVIAFIDNARRTSTSSTQSV